MEFYYLEEEVIVTCQVRIQPCGSGFKEQFELDKVRVLQMFLEGRVCQHLILDDAS